MLLNILNLPYTVTFNDIKSLIYSKCGIAEVILDNLVPHDNRTKKVTVGLSGEEDADIFMKNIDGTLFKGHQLRVVSKAKISKLSQPGAPDTIQPFMSQASAYPQGQNFRPNAPAMVPPPMNIGTANTFYPNQSAYYMMNQPTYATTSSLPNIGYQTVPYGNAGNQGYVRNPWSDNTWNQQQQSEGSQKSTPKKERAVHWDETGPKSRNNNLNWDKSQSQWDSSQSQWDNSQSQWDNIQSQWDNSQSQWDNSNIKRDNSNTKWDNSNTKWDNNSKWDNSNSKWDNSNSKWDNSNSKWDNSNSKWEGSNSQRGNNLSQRDNNPAPERDNRHESRWNNSSGDSNWHSHNDPRMSTSSDSNWQNSRESNRDNTYRSSQRAGASRGLDSPNRSYNRKLSPRPSGNIYTRRGDQVRNPSQVKGPRDNEPQQNRFRSPPRQSSPNNRGRALNRERNTTSRNAPGGSSARNNGSDPPSQRALQIGRLWRGQFIATKAKNILEDPRFQYDNPNPRKLRSTLISHIKRRVRINFEDDYSMKINQLESKYNKIYGFHGDWVALRDSLQKVGGRLLSKVDADAGEQNPCKTIKTNRKARRLQRQIDKLTQEVSQHGGQPEHDEQRQPSTSVIGNIQEEQQGVQLGVPPPPRSPQPGGSQSSNKIQGNASNQVNTNIPLALIPGRIPHYPQGDKKLQIQHKQNAKEILTGDLSSPIFSFLKPPLKNAIDEEVELMCSTIDKFCVNTGQKDAIPPEFCQVAKGIVSEEMRRVLKVSLARRIIPILPTMLRVFASPPIKRPLLEDFLKSFKVTALKKSKQNNYYIVNVNSIQDHDKLCRMKDVPIGQSLVSFKPLHLVKPRKMVKKNKRPMFLLPGAKATENATENAAQKTEKEKVIKDVAKIEGVDDDHNDDYEVEENWIDDNMDSFTAEEGQEPKLCQKMKNIYDRINNDEPIDIEEYIANDNEDLSGAVGQSNEEAFQAFQSVQVADSDDFTADVDLDNIMKNLSEVVYDTNSAQNESVVENKVNETMENEPQDENIDMVDVNEEDLEDW